jgi:hypothetical protein
MRDEDLAGRSSFRFTKQTTIRRSIASHENNFSRGAKRDWPTPSPGVSDFQIRRDKGLRAIYSETKEIAFYALKSAGCEPRLLEESRCVDIDKER